MLTGANKPPMSMQESEDICVKILEAAMESVHTFTGIELLFDDDIIDDLSGRLENWIDAHFTITGS